MKVGFIGLGIMGAPDGGAPDQGRARAVPQHPPATCRPIWSRPAGRACASPAEVAEKADVIITMVPDTPDVETVLFGPERRRRGSRRPARPSST